MLSTGWSTAVRLAAVYRTVSYVFHEMASLLTEDSREQLRVVLAMKHDDQTPTVMEFKLGMG